MKKHLLVCCQTLDRQSPTLGFFHEWVRQLAPYFERIDIIALGTGEYILPPHCHVFSLEKERLNPAGATSWTMRSAARLGYARRLVSALLKTRHAQSVFVHQAQEFVLFGGLFWRLRGVKIYLWRNHYAGTFLTDIACALSDTVFYTSRSSYTADKKNAHRMPVGVAIPLPPLAALHPSPRTEHSLLYLARLDPSKHPALLIEALAKIKKDFPNLSVTIAGAPSPAFADYHTQMETLGKKHALSNVQFVGAIPGTHVAHYYESHALFYNGGGAGMLDKTIFEALAHGALPISSSPDFAEFSGGEFSFKEQNVESLAIILTKALRLTKEERYAVVAKWQTHILPHHSLENTIKLLVEKIS